MSEEYQITIQDETVVIIEVDDNGTWQGNIDGGSPSETFASNVKVDGGNP